VVHASWAGSKLTRYLMGFTGEARYGDWVETLLYNGIGATLLVQPGRAFLLLCRLPRRHGRKDVLLEVEWTHAGQTVRLRQETTFPESDQTALHLTLESPAEFALRIRVSSWSKDASVMVNGEQFTVKWNPTRGEPCGASGRQAMSLQCVFLCMRVWCR